MEQGTTRNRGLDGLRGFATLIVLLHHHSYLNSGWLGIDIFFVLSGYLITNILRRNRESPCYWRTFWIKRFTRIFPPLLLLLAALTIIYHLSFFDIAGYFFSLGDVLTYYKSFAPADPLWSLAVEEHFYILWPFAVKMLPDRALVYLLGGIVLVEPILRMLLCFLSTDWRFYYLLTPFRLDGLSLGCLLSITLASENGKRLLSEGSSWLLVLSCSTWVVLRLSLGQRFTREHPSFAYNGLAYSIIALASFSLIAYMLTHPSSKLVQIFSWRVLTFTGLISYGLYLYQLVIREVLSQTFHLTRAQAILIDAPVTFLLAWISYKFYERPITDWGRRTTDALQMEAESAEVRISS